MPGLSYVVVLSRSGNMHIDWDRWNMSACYVQHPYAYLARDPSFRACMSSHARWRKACDQRSPKRNGGKRETLSTISSQAMVMDGLGSFKTLDRGNHDFSRPGVHILDQERQSEKFLGSSGLVLRKATSRRPESQHTAYKVYSRCGCLHFPVEVVPLDDLSTKSTAGLMKRIVKKSQGQVDDSFAWESAFEFEGKLYVIDLSLRKTWNCPHQRSSPGLVRGGQDFDKEFPMLESRTIRNPNILGALLTKSVDATRVQCLKQQTLTILEEEQDLEARRKEVGTDFTTPLVSRILRRLEPIQDAWPGYVRQSSKPLYNQILATALDGDRKAEQGFLEPVEEDFA